jgi:hypothetical protein
MKETLADLLPWECSACGLEFTPGEITRGLHGHFTKWATECPRCRNTIFVDDTERVASRIIGDDQIAKGGQ